jgi:DNA processing protein
VPIPRGPTQATDDLNPVRLAVPDAVPADAGSVGAGEIALAAGVSVPTALVQLSALEVPIWSSARDDGWRAVCRADRPDAPG